MKDFAFNICLLGTVAALLASSHVTAGFLDLTADRFAPALSSGEATAEFRTSLPPVSSFSSSLATIQPVRQRSTSKNYESRATESGSFVTNTRDLAATRVTSAPLSNTGAQTTSMLASSGTFTLTPPGSGSIALLALAGCVALVRRR
ncbi:MAG: hypothetical protein DWI09_08380 [Planctomycetota bacterium]|nr:MAG: hypothetical protein DWI09_08380 [Planctomycetota bacterium]